MLTALPTAAEPAHEGPVCSSKTPVPSGPSAPAPESLRFAAVYQEYFDFVWRSVRGLGVAASGVDDAVQEIFVVVHRRLPEFEGRSTLRTWLSGIVLNVARRHRRAAQRKNLHELEAGSTADIECVAGDADPYEATAAAEGARLLQRILSGLDDEKREVFVLAELEELTVPEIAGALGIKLNTAYSRLRLARVEFERALARERARDARRGT
jgi:RNA polymerase sigma-70 factor, ECF subfamily